MIPALTFSRFEKVKKKAVPLPLRGAGLVGVLWRCNDHLVKRPKLNRLAGHQKKRDGVTQQFLFLRKPKMSFGAGCFRTSLDV
jgi:hypothetical protein